MAKPASKPTVHSGLPAFGPQWDMGFHAHPGVEIAVVLEGGCDFRCNGGTYRLDQGSVVLIRSGVSHWYGTREESVRFAVMDVAGMPDALPDEFARMTPAGSHAVLRLSVLHAEQFEDLFRVWLRMASEPGPNAELAATRWTALFLLFIRQYGRAEPSRLSIEAAADHIRTQLASDVQVGTLARLGSMSVSAFRRAFHAAYGMSPKQYQQECRMAEAKWLLRSTHSPIRHIAAQVGYGSVHSFSAWFHDKEGLPPSEWRQRQYGTT